MRRLLLLMIAFYSVSSPVPAALVVFDWATVGNAGNANDPTTGFGRVDYEYRISKHEVTNGQYTEFLNQVASTDTYGLFRSDMDITRSGSTGSYSYAANSGFRNKPATWVSYFNAMRFTNWLENGQASGATETGVYSISATGLTETRAPNATFFIPTENEWYKAAYHDPRTAAAGGPAGDDNYWQYATMHDELPTAEHPLGGSNSGNFLRVVNDTTDVGAYTSAPSFYGTFDQAGNLWEWNETVVDPIDPSDPQARGLRGAGYSSDVEFARAVVRGVGGPAVEKFKIGFRVATIAMVPEPSSFLYGGVIVLSLLIKTWYQSKAVGTDSVLA